MSSAKVVPTQPRSSPMTVIVRRLPDWQGEMVSAALDEQSLGALRALTTRHQQTAVSVLCEAIERARDRAGVSVAVKSYQGMLDALAIVAGTKKSAVVRAALVAPRGIRPRAHGSGVRTARPAIRRRSASLPGCAQGRSEGRRLESRGAERRRAEGRSGIQARNGYALAREAIAFPPPLSW